MKTNTTKTLIALVVTAAVAPVTVAHATTPSQADLKARFAELKRQQTIQEQGDGILKTVANRIRTQQQVDALNAAHRERFNELKAEAVQAQGDGLLKGVSNRIRTQQQTDALHGAELTNMNQDRTASQSHALNAAHVDRFKQLASERGEALTLANQERTASQAVSLIQTVSNHVDSVEKNANHANTNATAALHMIQRSDKAIVAVTEAVQGQQLEQMNRDRTANQRVQPVVGHDGADGKDGVTTVITRVETDTATQDQVKTNTKAIEGTEIELLGESNLRRVSDLNLQHQISATNAKLQGDQLTQANRDRTANQRVQPVVGHDGADGKNGIDGAAGKDGINGADGKDGVTTVVTRVETDTATQDQVSVNSDDLKGLQLQQANRDRTAQQQVNNATSLRAVSSEQAVQGEFVQRQATVINQHSARIDQDSDAIAHNSQRIDQNAKRIDETKEDLKRGLNNAAAMSSLHFNGNRDSWALSTGSANGEGAALAGGMQKSLTEHTAVTVQYSDSLSGGYMVGAGIHGDW